MDPNSGRLYASVEDARRDGVENPVLISGRELDVRRVSDAIKVARLREQEAALAALETITDHLTKGNE